MRILLIDDEKEFVATLAERLSLRGIKADWVLSAKDAINIINKKSFDAVVLDLMMPEMDGLELLKIIKEKNQEMQVILLTDHASVDKGIEAMKLGAMDLIEKPVDLSIIADRIKRAEAEKIILVEKKTEKDIRDALI